MENIEPRSFCLEIKEYGKVVRQYNDKDYKRFMTTISKLINEHLSLELLQRGDKGEDEIKNVSINLYTY